MYNLSMQPTNVALITLSLVVLFAWLFLDLRALVFTKLLCTAKHARKKLAARVQHAREYYEAHGRKK